MTPVTKRKSLKRKQAPPRDSEYEEDVELNVQDIVPSARKVVAWKKILTNVPKMEIDNILLHSIKNVEKLNFVCQRRLALKRELGKDALDCKKLVSLIEHARLMKSVVGLGKCYELLVKEFIMNISVDCDNKKSKEYRKVFVRGR